MAEEVKRWESVEAFEVTCKVFYAIGKRRKKWGMNHICVLLKI